jgi:ABC-type oligopeptide transport system substrate-binding subunit
LITNATVRTTLKWMKDDPRAGLMYPWRDMLANVSGEANAHQVSVKMERGFIDPQALMTFKLLPPTFPRREAAQERFAMDRPVGSGPFRLAAKSRHDPASGKDYLAFEANPYYGSRPSAARRPYLNEVRLYYTGLPNIAKALVDNQIDLALDLTAEQAATLMEKGFVVPLPKPNTTNRRIYFLAVNCRHALLKNPAMRQALARAIPREAILDKVFRSKALKGPVHNALNGPYPATSWASDPALVKKGDKFITDIFDADLARAKFKDALKKAGVKEADLQLSYPTGDPQLADAMKLLSEEMMRALPGLTLKLNPLSPLELRAEVERGKTWHLAYYHYDFPEGAFWLWPLLGPGPTGENFLGYAGPLREDVQKAVDMRFFPRVRQQTHEIHRKFLRSEMPFIPLWQLTPLMAWKRGTITAPPFDLNAPFARIAEWSVKHPTER